MQNYAHLCTLMHTYANYAHICKSYANLFQFILFEYFWSLQPHSRKLRRRRTKISRGICVKIHCPESPLLPCLMEFVMKSQCPSLQRYPVSAYWEKAGAKSCRREELKRKAEHLPRFLCKLFSFVTSKTMSIKDTRDVIQTFGNVSWLDQASLLLFYSISSENM